MRILVLILAYAAIFAALICVMILSARGMYACAIAAFAVGFYMSVPLLLMLRLYDIASEIDKRSIL